MQFNTSDPDIATIVRRIERKVIDLQPEFQRGEVWSTNKKQRLIDTILRRWHVPPIHLVAKDEGLFDVLDGQQRLTAIRDFVDGLFGVDASIEPHEEKLQTLDGLRFNQLPEGVRNQFESFPIRVFELHDYTPQEPHELFFRLNQPTALTEAEKRNAFIGGPRNQVKDLVKWSEAIGMEASRIGFSNARMSYDDLLARFLITLEQRTLLEKVTAARITNRYRDALSFSEDVVVAAKASLNFFLGLDLLDNRVGGLKPNKATIHSWLCMAAKLHRHGILQGMRSELAATVEYVERARLNRSAADEDPRSKALGVFHDRSTSRVADTSSVMLRDLTGWMIFVRDSRVGVRDAVFLQQAVEAWKVTGTGPSPEKRLSDWAAANRWGGKEWL
ncbi:DUF262 domain-containing protein [Umezawaea tangerina]|uniref:Uncharacterized protein DUF262 n=1 Tax=Umezawaea tangerina TaxID=84725 RepID=A0A2T0T3S8_9PSEU|nr:DUF262 domain-containing protein [Umezawaea tangerina]PRY40317.1 uncharacterized protein DUF262 [Umezawaea tangerina]